MQQVSRFCQNINNSSLYGPPRACLKTLWLLMRRQTRSWGISPVFCTRGSLRCNVGQKTFRFRSGQCAGLSQWYQFFYSFILSELPAYFPYMRSL